VDDDELPECPPWSSHASVPRWIGVVPYESRRGLERAAWTSERDSRPPATISEPTWARYPAVVRIDHRTGEVMVVGVSHRAVDALARAMARGPRSPPGGPLVVELHDPEPPSRHVERVAAAVELIAAGDLYQVSLSRRLRVLVPGPGAPDFAHRMLELYARLSRRAPSAFGACLEISPGAWVLSTTPELLLDASVVTGSGAGSPRFGRLLTAPIKGTRPRGAHARQDREFGVELDRDVKERAELTMIIDVERNDLGRIAETGSVRMVRAPHVVTHRTVHHREAWVTARAKSDVSRLDVLESMLPSGSVTGAPKVRAMEVIADLEPHRRGLYTGALGYVAHDGSARLAMAIRTAVLRDGEGEYLTGGGIVADSNPELELLETTWKSEQIRLAAQGDVSLHVG